ncbi:sialoadhesin-like isoform X2 [Acanthopagrus latus]|uniref:sialoadhesin-like isoform X2 n=1 Tax=Acanthopagrus latus TaxID=8177 RepID=UPI00187BCB0E|nr:sialoadhesin-like isoform X2 [Acanthopagrus latus]
MSLSAAVSGFVVFLLSVSVIQGQDGWGVTYSSTEVCAFKGSTVDMSCTYRYPSTVQRVENRFWFRTVQNENYVDLKNEPGYSGRVQYDCINKDCSLKITDLRESDSAEYKFRFITDQEGGTYTGSPGVTLTVTDPDLQVQVSRSSYSSWRDLKCHSSCRLPDRSSYIWYKSGEKIPSQTSSTYSNYFNYADSYSCAVEGHEDFPSPPVCVDGQTCNRVIYTDRSICVSKGSSVDISCTYSSYGTIRSKFWFSPERSHQWQSPSQPEDLSDSQFAGRVQVLESERGRSTLRITDLTESDSAEYKLRFITDQEGGTYTGSRGVTLRVTDPDLQVQVSRSLYSSWRELKCHSSCCLPDRSSYIWYRNGQKIPSQTSSTYSVYYNYADLFSCAVEGHEDFPSPPVCVYGQTCNRVIYTDRSICASKGSSVDISCTYSSYYTITSKFWFSPERSHQWQSPSQPEDLSDSQFAGRVQVLEGWRGRSTLRITDLTESDSAEYKFMFITNQPGGRYTGSPGVTLRVTDLQVQVSRSLYYGWRDLKCHSSCRLPDRSSYIWYRNGQKIPSQTSSTYSVDFNYADSYSCAVEGHEDFPSPPVCVYGQTCNRVIYTDRRICASKGSSVDISCTYSSFNIIRSKFWFSPERSHQWQSPSQPEDLSDSQFSGRVQVLESERGRSTLRITDLTESDSAEYKFRFITDQEGGTYTGSPGVTLRVTDPDLQVQVSRSSDSSWRDLKCHSSCHLPDRSSYIWYKSGQKIPSQTSSTYSVDFNYADSYSCAVEGHEDFPSPPVCVDGQTCNRVIYTDRSICASKGSSVDISCTYSSFNIIRSKFWFSPDRSHQWQSPSQPEDLSDSQFAGRVQVLESERRRSTLRITDLTESDSAEYKFRFITDQEGGTYTGSRGVTLRVTDPDLQVQVSRSSYSSWRDLKCHSSCRLPDRSSYIWYKSGEKIPSQTSSTYSNYYTYADSYSCAVEGHEDFPSPPVCVDGQTCNRVIYTDRSICASKGSSVDISCTYSSYGTIRSKFWFSPERSHQWQSPSQPEDLSDSQFAGRVQVLESERGHSTLRITDLTESDSAEYKLRFITDQEGGTYTGSRGVTLRVTDPDLQVKVSRSSDSSWKYLKCHSSCRLPDRSSYIWYRNGRKIPSQTSSTYSVYYTYAASFSCAVEGHEDFPSPPVCADGQTCNRVIYTDRSICASKGSSVDISCTYSSDEIIKSKFWFSPERSHQWQSPSQPEDLSDSQFAGRVQVLESERGRSTLRITDLTESDSAQYHFKFTTQWSEWRSSLPGTTLTVTALQVQVTRITVHQSDTEAELKCHSSCSPAARLSYVWFKNGQRVTGVETSSFKGRVYPGDIISCALKGHENYGSPPVYGPRLPSVSVSPSAEIVEGSSVTLTCSSDANPAAKYTWYKEHGDPDLQPLSKDPQLVFSSIQSSDSGEYNCTAENQLGRRTSEYIYVNVTYGPRLPSVSVSPSAEIVEGSSVTLTCSSDANPAANYTWYKENEDSPKASGQIFTITDFRAEHSGNYSCEVQNRRGRNKTSVHLTVLAVSWKSVAAGTITVVLLAIISLSVFLWIRKKRSSRESTEAEERPDNREQGESEEQDDFHYTSVHFSNNQADNLYSNIRPAQPRRHVEQQEVEYAAVRFNSASTAPRARGQGAAEDPAALYSTVNKTC